MNDETLTFAIETWTAGGSVERVIGRVGPLLVAKAAFAEACRRYPAAHLTLRQRARVIEEHRPDR